MAASRTAAPARPKGRTFQQRASQVGAREVRIRSAELDRLQAVRRLQAGDRSPSAADERPAVLLTQQQLENNYRPRGWGLAVVHRHEN